MSQLSWGSLGLSTYQVAHSEVFLLRPLCIPLSCHAVGGAGAGKGKLSSPRFFFGGFLGLRLQDVYKTLNQFKAQRFSIREADCADRVKRPVASEDHSI